MAQVHKKFSDLQVKEMIARYLAKEIKREHIQTVLGIKRRRFCELVKKYRDSPEDFSVEYKRKTPTRAITDDVEENIIIELSRGKNLINDPAIPIRNYNYSYIKDMLDEKYANKVSLPTIISRTKKYNFYISRRKRQKTHDREVITDYAGWLIQHDSSKHKWSPYADDKWHLITSLDDFSRYILYAALVEKETTWTHIAAMEQLILKYGLPYSYYVDSH